MSYPDFSPQGYQVIRELGRNREGGRITWLALDLSTERQVVLKQFGFAIAGSNWSAFSAHEREIQVLRGLNHPGIPRYLGALSTADGFCLIQEYKNAPTLAVGRSFEADEIKQIAVKVLSILVYLQNRIPPVIHRDIKPENILVDDQLNVYLIDFGMSRIGSEEVSGSSVFKGTPGFLPPEQMRQPTIASDLYGLGATLICLLTGTPSVQIQKLTDDDDVYVYNFRHLLPQLSLRFLNWLELMVKPRLKDRFTNAQFALEALKPLDVVRVPGVELSTSVLELTATQLGENRSQTITVENPIPDTVLQGKWEVAPHPQDPPHTPDSHPWIRVEPAKFRQNNTVCRILVDTSNLMADKLYKRQLFLHTNAYPEIYPITVRVQTAPLPIERRKVPYAWLLSVLLLAVIISWFTSFSIATAGAGVGAMIGVWAVAGAVAGAMAGVGARAGAMAGAVIGVWAGAGAMAGAGVWAVIGVWAVAGKDMSTNVLLTLTAGLGTSFGIGCIVGLLNPYILLAIALTGLPIVTMLLYPPLKRRKLVAKYRQSESRLIKP